MADLRPCHGRGAPRDHPDPSRAQLRQSPCLTSCCYSTWVGNLPGVDRTRRSVQPLLSWLAHTGSGNHPALIPYATLFSPRVRRAAVAARSGAALGGASGAASGAMEARYLQQGGRRSLFQRAFRSGGDGRPIPTRPSKALDSTHDQVLYADQLFSSALPANCVWATS